MTEGFGDMSLFRESMTQVARAVGPLVTVDAAREMTGLGVDEFASRVANGDVLVLTSGDDGRVFPTFQLGPDGSLLPGLRKVLRALQVETLGPWLAARWLTARPGVFGDRSAADVMRAGDVKSVLTVAKQAAAARSE